MRIGARSGLEGDESKLQRSRTLYVIPHSRTLVAVVSLCLRVDHLSPRVEDSWLS